MRRALLGAAAAAAAAVLAAANPFFDPAKPHHTESGFRNSDGEVIQDQGFWRWQWERRNGGLAPAPPGGWKFEVVRPDFDFLRANRQAFSATWLGHATVLVQMGGVNVLADPVFSERASPFDWIGPKRALPLGFSVEELPRIDVVVISHNHYDHLDRASVLALNAQPGGAPLFLVPLGLKAWMADIGITQVRELDWFDTTASSGFVAHFVPVHHWSKRALWDRDETLWGGWVLEAGGKRFFHAGDTGYSRDFAEIGRRYGPIDLAAIPIGGYAPRWFMEKSHVDPEEAVRIHRDVRAKRSIAVHWGTFEALTDEPLDEPPRKLLDALATGGISSRDFVVLKHGETLKQF